MAKILNLSSRATDQTSPIPTMCTVFVDGKPPIRDMDMWMPGIEGIPRFVKVTGNRSVVIEGQKVATTNDTLSDGMGFSKLHNGTVEIGS